LDEKRNSPLVTGPSEKDKTFGGPPQEQGKKESRRTVARGCPCGKKNEGRDAGYQEGARERMGSNSARELKLNEEKVSHRHEEKGRSFRKLYFLYYYSYLKGRD